MPPMSMMEPNKNCITELELDMVKSEIIETHPSIPKLAAAQTARDFTVIDMDFFEFEKLCKEDEVLRSGFLATVMTPLGQFFRMFNIEDTVSYFEE